MKHKTNGNGSRTTEQRPTHRPSGKGCKNLNKLNTEMAKSKYPVVPYFCQIIFRKSAKIIFQITLKVKAILCFQKRGGLFLTNKTKRLLHYV